MELYYIAHDHNENSIEALLNEARAKAQSESGITAIFYLANGKAPLSFSAVSGDEEEYARFIETLKSKVVHNVSPVTDRERIMAILNQELGDAVDLSGKYDRIVFSYLINPMFVQMGFCDSVIGQLFWDLDFKEIPVSKLEIIIMHHADDDYEYNPQTLFGRKNLLSGFPFQMIAFQ